MIYLDNAATSWPKPACVQQAMVRFLAEDAANPGRAGHRMAVAAERMLDDLRAKLARLFDAPDPARVVLTLNCTDALNMAIKGVLREGDHVITSTLEHNSVSRPLNALAEARRIELTRVRTSACGFVEPAAVERAITAKTRLIAVTHCSNVLGTIQPVGEIGRMAREHGAIFLLDAAQSAGLLPISVREMHIDLLAFAGHKSLLGPPGTGGLYVAEGLELAAWREGGTGGDSASPTQPREYPYWLEGGTPNTVGAAGLSAAIDYLAAHDPAKTLDHERTLARRLAEALADDRRFKLLGGSDYSRRTGLVTLVADGFDAHGLANALDASFGVAVRPGLHCAPYIHRQLGAFPDGGVRISPGPFNTAQEMDLVADALRRIVP